MPGQGRKHLQLVGIGFADAWPGLEASAICWNWICRCISWGRKHPQLAGIGFADAWLGLEASATCWNWICRCISWGRKHLQLVGIGFADAWSGSEASATCWNWICRCLVRIGSICNLLVLELQMPGRGWKHLQFAGIGFVDAWSGLEASATCWYWTCRCLSWGRKHLQFAGIGFVDTYRGEFRMWKYLQFTGIGYADAWSGSEASTTCWNWICRCLVGIGSICNLLVLDL